MSDFVSTHSAIFLTLVARNLPSLRKVLPTISPQAIYQELRHPSKITAQALQVVGNLHQIRQELENKISELDRQRAPFEEAFKNLLQLYPALADSSTSNGASTQTATADSEESKALGQILEQLEIFTNTRAKLYTLSDEMIEREYRKVDEIILQNQQLWNQHFRHYTESLIDQLQEIHQITLTAEERAGLQQIDAKNLEDTQANLASLGVKLSRAPSYFEILAANTIVAVRSRRLENLEEIAKLVKQLPVLKEENGARLKLQQQTQANYQPVLNMMAELKEKVAKIRWNVPDWQPNDLKVLHPSTPESTPEESQTEALQ